MNARRYVQLYMFFQGATIFCLLLGLIFLSLTGIWIWLLIAGDAALGLRDIGGAVIALMSVVFLAGPVSCAMRSKKACDDLEQRGLLEEAASQLKEQSPWGKKYILTKDFYFDRAVGNVICLQDVAAIGLIREKEWDEDRGNVENIQLRLTTRQGNALNISSTGPQAEKEEILQHFELLQARYPEKISNSFF